MLRGFKDSLAAKFRRLRRPPNRLRRRAALCVLALEDRAMLSANGADTRIAESIRPGAVGDKIHPPEAARVDRQVKFVDSLFEKYFHRGPDAAELGYALQLLASGVSRKALTADFKAITSKTGKGITEPAFVAALYVTVAGESPTPVGMAYWQGVLDSGASRSQVRQMFTASDGLLPAPAVSWSNPSEITAGTPLGPAQLDATASVPGTFAYDPPAGTVLGAGTGQVLSVVFTPADTADYPIVDDAVSINVTALPPSPTPTPTPTPTPPPPPTPAPTPTPSPPSIPTPTVPVTPTPTPTPTPWPPSMGIIVPAYFAPGSGGPGGVGDGWAAMAAAAAKVPLTAIFNPNSGPLPGPASTAYADAFTQLEDAGGKVVAYVYTDNGDAPIGTVEGQISTYITQYGSQIEGFLLDGMLVTPSTLSYYQGLDTYIKNLNPLYTVIGNPGQPYLNGVSPQDYLSTADVFNIFEGPDSAPSGSPGYNTYPYGVNWFESYPSDRFSNTIYDVAADAGDPGQSSAMLADVTEAAQLDTGYVDITNLSGDNPYDGLPSYWDQEVSAVAATPQPGTSSARVPGGRLASLAVAAKKLHR